MGMIPTRHPNGARFVDYGQAIDPRTQARANAVMEIEKANPDWNLDDEQAFMAGWDAAERWMKCR